MIPEPSAPVGRKFVSIVIAVFRRCTMQHWMPKSQTSALVLAGRLDPTLDTSYDRT